MPDVRTPWSTTAQDRAATADAIDGAQMMLVAGLGDAGIGEVDPEAGTEEGLLDIVSGERVAGEDFVDIAATDELAQSGTAAGVDDGRAADDECLAALSAVGHEVAGDLADREPLGFSVDTPLDMNVKSPRTAMRSAGMTRTPLCPMTIDMPRWTSVIGMQRAVGSAVRRPAQLSLVRLRPRNPFLGRQFRSNGH